MGPFNGNRGPGGPCSPMADSLSLAPEQATAQSHVAAWCSLDAGTSVNTNSTLVSLCTGNGNAAVHFAARAAKLMPI